MTGTVPASGEGAPAESDRWTGQSQHEGTNAVKRRSGVTLILLTVLSVGSCGVFTSHSGRKTEEPVFSQIGQHVLPQTRRVEVTCELTVDDIPKETKEVRVWLPFPSVSGSQQVFEPTLSHPTSYRPVVRYDQRYGSRVLTVSGEAPLPESFAVAWSARVDRGVVDHHDVTFTGLPADNATRETLRADLDQVHLAPLVGEDLTPEDVAKQRADQVEAFRKTVAAIVTVEPATPDDNATVDVARDLDAAQAAARRRDAVGAAGSTLAHARAIYDYVVYKLNPDNSVGPSPAVAGASARGGGAAGQRTVREILDAGTGDAADALDRSRAAARAPARNRSARRLWRRRRGGRRQTRPRDAAVLLP